MPKSASSNRSATSVPGINLLPWLVGGVVAFTILVSEQAGWLAWSRLARVTADPGIRLQSGGQMLWQRAHRQWFFWEDGVDRLAQLEHDFARLQVDRAELDRLRAENQQLLAASTGVTQERMTVRWYGSKNNWFISAGCDHGVEPAAPVLFQGALVGQVTEVSPTYSRVQSWDDPDWRLAVKVGTQSAQGVFHSERGVWEVTDVRRGTNVEVKSVVRTAGQGILPPDLAIATVDSVNEETGFGTVALQVQPLIQLEDLHWGEVLRTTQESTCSE